MSLVCEDPTWFIHRLADQQCNQINREENNQCIVVFNNTRGLQILSKESILHCDATAGLYPCFGGCNQSDYLFVYLFLYIIECVYVQDLRYPRLSDER